MPRRRAVVKRDVLPDPRYDNKMVTKFINSLMLDGKKSTAEGIFYGSLDIIKDRTNEYPLEIFMHTLNNVKPSLEVKSSRIGAATYQVPIEVPPARSIALAMRWLIQYSRARGEKTMAEKLAAELIMASRKEGASIKKREDTHKMAEANKAFAHFRW